MTTWTDKFIADLASILDRCEADLRRALPSMEIERSDQEVGTGWGPGSRISINFGWTARDTHSFTIKFGTGGADASEDLDEAFSRARETLAVVALAAQWQAEFGSRVWPNSTIDDPEKCAAADREREQANELSTARAQASTDRRREVLAKVKAGEDLTEADKGLARKMDLLIEHCRGAYRLTTLAQNGAAS